jgi:hypothetical protein
MSSSSHFNTCPRLWDLSSPEAPVTTGWCNRQHVATFKATIDPEKRILYLKELRQFSAQLCEIYPIDCLGVSYEYWVSDELLGFRCDFGEQICARMETDAEVHHLQTHFWKRGIRR